MKRICEVCHKEYDDEKEGVELGTQGNSVYFCSTDCFSKAARKKQKAINVMYKLFLSELNKVN